MLNARRLGGRSRYLVPMLKRSLDLLRSLARSIEGGVGLAELSRAVHAPKSSVVKIVNAPEPGGFISRNRPTRRDQLTLKRLALGTAAVERVNLRRELDPLLEELKTRPGECVDLGSGRGLRYAGWTRRRRRQDHEGREHGEGRCHERSCGPRNRHADPTFQRRTPK